MSHILGKSANAKQPKAIGSLSFQTSQRGSVIPLVYGTNKLSPNLLDYDDFTATAVKTDGGGGKGKGGGKSGSKSTDTFTYSASVLWGLCQGPIDGIGSIWENNAVLNQSSINLNIHTGADGQAADTFWTSNHSAKALTYSGTAYLATPNLNLGSSATLPGVTVEILSTFTGAGSTGQDAFPDEIISDFLTNPRYGAGFPTANLAALTDYKSYCDTLLISLSPVLMEQREALQHLDEITKITNSAILWSGDLLKIIPYGDSAIASSAVWHVTIEGGDLTGGASFSLTMTDAGVAVSPETATLATTQGGILTQYASAFANEITNIAAPFNIVVSSISSTSADPVSGSTTSVITLIQQPATATTTITVGSTGVPGATIAVVLTSTPPGSGYDPNVTPVYELTEDDFITDATSIGGAAGSVGGGAGIVTHGANDPVQITRSSPADLINKVTVEWLDRGNRYNTEIAEAWDQASIDDDGLRTTTPFKARAVADPAVASICANLALNRGMLYRNTYTFRLGWKYCLLEPMDLVTLTDSRLGLNQTEVRITSIEEDAEGTLTVTAEDFILGYASTPLYPGQPGQGYHPNWNEAAGSINPPVIFEPPTSAAAFQVWIGVSGGEKMGSVQVFLSSDGSSYAPLTPTLTGSRQGVLTAPLPSGVAVDVTNTLSVDLSQSRGVLTSVSSSDAASLVTIGWVGDADGSNGELIAYQTATLTDVNEYDLTTLYRGASGSDISAHATGSQYLFIDADKAIGKFDYPAAWVGQTVYFKFLTSNIVGGGSQSLADVGAYPYTLTGGTIVPQPVFITADFGPGLTGAGDVSNVYVAPIAISFAANFGPIAGATTLGRASAPAATPEDFPIDKALAATPNTWVQIGIAHLNTAAVAPSFTTTGGLPQSLAPGDSIRVRGTATPDATLTGLIIVLAGSR